MTQFSVGQVVRNFNITAVVVGIWTAADGSQGGHPILRELGPNGKPRWGKWVADPAKCEVIGEVR